MAADRLLTLRNLEAELFAVHRQHFNSSPALDRLRASVSKAVSKYPSGWGHEGSGADMPQSLATLWGEFPDLHKFIKE